MDKEKYMVNDFLKHYGMDYASIDIDEGCKEFIEEMNKGLSLGEGSLKMIPTYIAMEREIPVEKSVIVVDAGGTNFRVAVAHFNRDKKPIIEDYNMYPMPGTGGEVSKEEFYNTIAGYLKPVLNKSNKISFCFSYPAEALPNKDGRLLQLSKEVRIKGLVGDVIGENLFEYIKRTESIEDKKIVMLNDSVATLLGGKASYPDREFDSYIGFILGTGTNTCYIEENSNIKKVGDLPQGGAMIINTESGGYNKIKRGAIDIEFDNETKDPGEYCFEKMISGRYQGGLLMKVIEKAVKDGLLSEKFKEGMCSISDITLPEINDFMYYPYSGNKLSVFCSDTANNKLDDHLVLYHIIDSIIERAAKLVTINLASILIKTGKGKNPCRPVCITADGSTFYKLKSFRSKLDYYIKSFMNDEKGLYCEFAKLENGTLIGTAIAGLLN